MNGRFPTAVMHYYRVEGEDRLIETIKYAMNLTPGLTLIEAKAYVEGLIEAERGVESV